MGEVFRAHDTRLHRDVAIKVLPSNVASDHDRVGRFEQEARATAALNHPNIVHVLDIGTHEGAPYVVLEFLDGQTVRELLSTPVVQVPADPAIGRTANERQVLESTAPIPQSKAVDYARQV